MRTASGPPPPWVGIKKIKRRGGSNPIVIKVDIWGMAPGDQLQVGPSDARSRVEVTASTPSGMANIKVPIDPTQIASLQLTGTAEIPLIGSSPAYGADAKSIEIKVILNLEKAGGAVVFPSTQKNLSQWPAAEESLFSH